MLFQYVFLEWLNGRDRDRNVHSIQQGPRFRETQKVPTYLKPTYLFIYLGNLLFASFILLAK